MSVRHVFVYGTLKIGQCNHYLIAPFVSHVCSATVRGALFDCGPWPALTNGNCIVHGELMAVREEDLETVFPVLDRLEGYDPEDEEHSPYLRRVVQCNPYDGAAIDAYVYLYSGPTDRFRPLPRGRWPEGGGS